MPLATPIPATSNVAVPALPANIGAHGKAASTQEFGALFREKASAIEASAITSAPKAAPAPQKDSEAAPLPASTFAPMPEIEPLSTEEAQAQPASGATALPGSPQAQLQPQSATELEADAKSTANPPLAATIETNLAAMPTGSEKIPAAPSKPASPSSTQAAHPQHKAKEASQSGTQSAGNTTLLTVTQPLAPFIPSPVAVATQPAAVASPAEKTSAQTGQNQSASNSSSARPAGPPVQAAQPAAGAPANSSAAPTTPGSADAGDAALHAAAGPNDVSKASSDSTAVAVRPGHAPAGQAAGQQAPTIPVAGSAVIVQPVAAHPASAEAAAVPPTAATPAAGPSVNSAAAPAASLYDKIDQGNAPVVLHSGAQQVTVGVRDPSLGWVEIKTQNTAGHIDATLVASSSQTHDSLAAQLPAMAQYLEERNVRVGTLAVQHPMTQANPGGGQNSNPGNGSNPNGSGGSNAQNFSQSGSGHEDNAARYFGAPPGSLRSASSLAMGGILGNPIEDTGASLRPVSYISVRA
ncbi:MAG: flagellar hook-length control protein FliK [Silvibacterium sp.]